MDQKIEELGTRIKWAAATSVVAAAIAITFLGVAPDVIVIMHELEFYNEQLGLDEKSLRRLGVTMGVCPEELANVAAKTYPVRLLGAAAIKAGISGATMLATGAAVEETVKYIPLLGPAISAGLSFGTIFWYLSSTLDKMYEAASRVMEEVLKVHAVNLGNLETLGLP